MNKNVVAVGLCLALIASSHQPARAAGGGPNGQRDLAAENAMLWRRLAVLTIREYLAQPGQAAVENELGRRLNLPADYMTVHDGSDNSLFVGHLRDFAKKSFPVVDGKRAVVVYLNGPVGGGGRIGVAFDRADGKALAVVPIPGK